MNFKLWIKSVSFFLMASLFLLKPCSAQIYKGGNSGGFYVGYGFAYFTNVAPVEIYAAQQNRNALANDRFGRFNLQQGLSFRICGNYGDSKTSKKGKKFHPLSMELIWINKHAKSDAAYADSGLPEVKETIRLRYNSVNLGALYTPAFELVSFGGSMDVGLMSCKFRRDISGDKGKWTPLFPTIASAGKISPVAACSVFFQLNIKRLALRLGKQFAILPGEFGQTFYTENINLSAYFRF